MPRGGDPLNTDVNAQYAGLEFHYVFLITMGFLVWLIIPGIGATTPALGYTKWTMLKTEQVSCMLDSRDESLLWHSYFRP